MNKKHKKALAFLKRKFKSKVIPISIGIFVGAALYIAIFGISYLNPLHTEWLYSGGDLTQHQVGWELFRQSNWSLPLGKTANLMYPDGASVVYTDSIPALAIIMKLVASFFNFTFQYFGIWGFITLSLQGAMAAFLVSHFTKSKLIILCSSIFACASFPLLIRYIGHDALTAHFLILAGFNLVTYGRHITGVRTHFVTWLLLVILTISIHPYFTAMIIPIYLTDIILRKYTLRQSIYESSLIAIIGIAYFWILGGLMTRKITTTENDFGTYGADILSMINPINNSPFIDGFSVARGAIEGFAYLGLAGIILVTLGIFGLLFLIKKGNFDIFKNLKSERKRALFIFTPLILTVIFAIGPKVYVGGYLLAELHLGRVAILLSAFRATGRFIWILYYLLIFCSLILLIYISRRYFNKGYARYLLSVSMIILVSLQLFEVLTSPLVHDKSDYTRRDYQGAQQHKCTDVIRNKLNFKHIEFVDDVMQDKDFYTLGSFASLSGATLNDGNLARRIIGSVAERKVENRNRIIEKKLANDTIYVTGDKDLANKSGSAGYVCDNLYFLSTNK